jgi:hypothetical protein
MIPSEAEMLDGCVLAFQHFGFKPRNTTSIVFVACTVPFFSYFMAFISAFTGFTLHELPKDKQNCLKFWIRLDNSLGILVTWSFICVLDTYISLKQTANHL